MKILPFDPRTVVTGAQLDDSRLGNHASPVTLDALADKPPGIALLGLADETGIRHVGGRLGAASAPAALRAKLYKLTTGAPTIPIYDLGDLPPLGSIEETHHAATQLVRRTLERGHVPVVIGGGHDLGFPHALGVLEARGGRRSAFVNIDAHLDVRPAQPVITSGSPWFLLREHPLFQKSKSRIHEFGLQRHCNAHVLVDYAERHRFDLHWLSDIREQEKDAARAFGKLLKRASSADTVLVSFDIDSVQWSEAPGCSAPQNVGFTAAEAIAMSRLSGAQKKVRSFGLFELSPPLDRDGQTASLAALCVLAFLEGRGVWRKKK